MLYGYNSGSSDWSSYTVNESGLKLHKAVVSDFHPVSSMIPAEIDRIHSTVTSDLSAAILVQRTVPPGPPRSWSEFLTQQPLSVQELLSSISLHVSIELIIDEYDKHGQLLLVSDGTAKEQTMAFGWTLASPDGKRLLIAAGHYGGRGSSLRSESAGMLSGSLFVGLLFSYIRRTSVTVTFVSDNLELIRRQQAHQKYSFPYANEIMRAEFDLTEQIFLTHKTYNIRPTFLHVKGHQDGNLKQQPRVT